MAPLITNGDSYWSQWWSPLVPMTMGCSIGAITSITIVFGANGSPLAPFFVAIGANGVNPKSLWPFYRIWHFLFINDHRCYFLFQNWLSVKNIIIFIDMNVTKASNISIKLKADPGPCQSTACALERNMLRKLLTKWWYVGTRLPTSTYYEDLRHMCNECITPTLNLISILCPC